MLAVTAAVAGSSRRAHIGRAGTQHWGSLRQSQIPGRRRSSAPQDMVWIPGGEFPWARRTRRTWIT